MQVTLSLYEADMINIILQNYMDKCIKKGNLHPDKKILIDQWAEMTDNFSIHTCQEEKYETQTYVSPTK